MGVEVRLAVQADAPRIGDVFARAFADDPVTSWVTPARERRLPLLLRLNELIARHEGIPRGATYVAVNDDAIVGAAIWQPPGRLRVGWRTVPFSLAAGAAIGRDVGRMVASGRAAARNREWTAWYLQLLGVDPSVQGTGVGSALVRAHLPSIDSRHARAGLETTVENLRFYGRLGFEVDHRFGIGRDGPTEFALRRAAV